jgi:cation diffusion facilitator family transporter
MHAHTIETWQHRHVFLGERHRRNEGRTWLVVALTLVMMAAEITGGIVFSSMALLADGWHMATHATALGIAALAYGFARRHAEDERFAFGTGKFGDLAAFASAIILALVALFIAWDSLLRLFAPVAISYDEALAVATLGLAVNIASAWLLRDEHDHHHDHHHHHHHHHHGGEGAHARGHAAHRHHDNNLRAAYVHVVADAAVSVLAIAGLLAGRFFGWSFMDPLMGIVGALVIARWAYGLLRDAGAVLLDATADRAGEAAIRAALERDGDRVADLHLWQVGPGHQAAVIALVSDSPRSPDHYKRLLRPLPHLSHVTVEVNRCESADHNRRAA